MGKPEGKIEDYLNTQAEKYGCMCYKFVALGKNGVPDRIVIGFDKFGNHHVDFIETKAPGEKPRLLQKIVHDDMRNHGAAVYVLSTKPAVDEYINKYFRKDT